FELIAIQFGISNNVIVAGGGGDNAVSAIGIGAVEPGDGFISLGTSGVLCIIDDGFHPCPESAIHSFCHAIPNRWLQMSVMLSAASCLRWICTLTSTTEEQLLQEVENLTTKQLETAPLFLPYLSGERTPHNDPEAKGLFFGITHDSNRAVLGYSVLEGVTMGLMDGNDLLDKCGTKAKTLSLLGGGARSSFWAQLIADAINVKIQRHKNSNAGGALGAARLGWLAAGGDSKDVLQKLPLQDEFLPNQERHKILKKRFEKFRQLYQLLKPLKLNI
uniref:Carbohydrate kinase FGGY C-terminal domain-containing protein n=1 Tax=Panagrolaimus sp. PS1159 TaxID=55785 RepID=A0AC35EUA0_9BILA